MLPLPHRPPALSVDDATRLQVFLDRENFGPGKLDGKTGEFTRKALARYGRAHGRTLPEPGPALLAALPEVRAVTPFREYTVTAADAAQVGTIPEDRAAQGKQASLPYTSLLEEMGEHFHAGCDFLRRLNPGRNLDALARRQPSARARRGRAAGCRPVGPARTHRARASRIPAARGHGLHDRKDARRARRWPVAGEFFPSRPARPPCPRRPASGKSRTWPACPIFATTR